MIAKRVERKMGSRYVNLIGYLLRETGQAVLDREKWNGRLPGLEAGGGGLRWTLTGRRHQSAQVEE